MDILREIKENVMAGQAAKVGELTQAALDGGMTLGEILDKGLISAMAELGERFQKQEIFVPQLLFAARAMKAGMEVLEPLLLAAKVEPTGKLVLGTVKGDVHDIGKNLVGIMLKGAGFQINDLGVDVPPEKFVDAAKEAGITMVCMSALLGTSMPLLKTTIDALAAAGLKSKVKTMVGGAIVTQRYANEIGADGYAPNASAAVDKAKELLELT